MNLEKLKYPTGRYSPNKNPDKELLNQWIADIASFPERVKTATQGASVEALNWRYRPGGWTVKQVIHHCADSHMNSYIRFKLALTEDTPVVRPYFEDKWAYLPDATDDDISDSLMLLEGLHKRWASFLKSLSAAQLMREYIHPEHGKKFNLAETIGNYAWHCNHHLAHIRNGINSEGKYNA